ncbi:MAG: type II toxin-antitoxin system YafQ family toxin [Mariniphaga sp.]|nr:type II toxin-antitoxin system YafQ family toxin [Mariniphaga sp.]
MFTIKYTGTFKKDLKTLKKRSIEDFETLRSFVKELATNGAAGIPEKHQAHKLKGKYARHHECHVLPDLLIIWMENRKSETITLVRTGTHSDLF